MLDPKDILIIAMFAVGVGATEVAYRATHSSDVDDCGVKPGYTTLVAKDDGELICIYRQDSYPFKTLSGRNV